MCARKYSLFICVFFVVFLMFSAGCSCQQQEEKTPTTQVTSKTEPSPEVASEISDSILAALNMAKPADGTKITQGNTIITWQPNKGLTDNFSLNALVQKDGDDQWQKIESDNLSTVKISN